MKKLILGLSILTSLSFGGECGCKITIEEVHGVVGNKCGVNEVMVGSEPQEHYTLLQCGKVVCHCDCMPEVEPKDWE